MSRFSWPGWCLILLAALASCSSDGEPPSELQLDWMYSDHMVLQRDREIIVSGTATPGRAISARLGEHSGTTIADPSGRFFVRLSAQPASAVPRTLQLECGEKKLELTDVVIGDVWFLAGAVGIDSRQVSSVRVCSRKGDWSLERRQLTSEELARLERKAFHATTWSTGTAAAAPSDDAWLAFGETLAGELQIPIGLIDATQEGTSLEGWLSRTVLESTPALRELSENFLDSPLTQMSVRSRARAQLRDWNRAGRPGPAPRHFLEPGYLHEAILADLTHLSLRGVAWRVSGEVVHAPEIARLIQNKWIQSWREAFGAPELEFVLQQLPASLDPLAPYYREVQAELAPLGGVHLASSYDLQAEQGRKLGRRLAQAALRKAGPSLLGWTSDPYSLSLELRDAEQLRWAAGAKGTGFELAGEDLRFYPARATRITTGVLLEAREVKRPFAARFAWSPAPPTTLLDATGAALAPFRTHPVSPVKIACIGDSLTYGHGLEEREVDAYPIRLAELLGDRFLVRNFSRSATTAAGTRFPGAWNPTFATTRQYGQALAFEPDVVVANLGTNDLTNWSTSGPGRAELFEAEYRDLLDAFQTANSSPEIWLWSPIAPLYPGQQNYGDEREAQLNASVARLAKSIGAHELDLHACCGGRPSWFPDKLHPNADGCRAIAAAVHASFGPSLLGVPVPPARPLRLICIQIYPNATPLPVESSHPADRARLVFTPGEDSLLRLDHLSSSLELVELGRKLWDQNLRDFALLPFSGNQEVLERRLAMVRMSLPRNEVTRVLAIVADNPKLSQVPGCSKAQLLGRREFSNAGQLAEQLLELVD